jgi:hypothetical protein
MEDNIKMDLQVVWFGGLGVYVIRVAWGRDRWWALVNMVLNLRVP